MGNSRKAKKLFIDLLLGRINIRKGLTKLKSEFPPNVMQDILEKLLLTNNKTHVFINKGLYPKTFDKLLKQDFIYNKGQNFYNELLWYAIIIKNNAAKINEFLGLKDNYENYLINGNCESAYMCLEEIEKEVCCSLWSLENWFILEEYSNGLEGNKQLLSNINKMDCHNWVLFLADIYSFKAERAINNAQYKHRIDKILVKISNEIKDYFKLKMLGIEYINSNDVFDLLICESNSSIIDRYNIFIKVCLILCTDDYVKPEIKALLNDCLNIIGFSINDKRLNYINFYLNGSKLKDQSVFDYEMNELNDIYTQGQYNEVIDKCKNILNENANCFEVYELYVKSIMRLQDDNLIESEHSNDSIRMNIIKSMFYSYTKDPDVTKSIIALQNIVRTFSGGDLGVNLLNFYINRFYIEKNVRITKLAQFYNKYSNARLCIALNDEKKNYLDEMEKTFGTASHIELFRYFYCSQGVQEVSATVENIESSRVNWYRLQKLISEKEYDEVLIELKKEYRPYKEKCGAYANYARERNITVMFNIEMERQNYYECMKIFVDNYLINRMMVIRMDGELLYSKICNNLTFELKKDISLPILTHINKGSENTAIYSAYANFIDSQGITKPSDLFSIQGEFEQSKLIYFLRYICTTDVIDSAYSVFDSEEKVDNERINICQFLRSIDSENESSYINQISLLTQKSSLSKSIQYFDESKIDLDIQKIRNAKKEVFKDNFKRYKEIGNFNVSYEIIDITDKKYFLINFENTTDNIISKEKKNQKYLLFKEMLLDYRDEFAFGKYGLDTSLGTRIRHGTLQNQIRSVFEQHGLVYSKKNYNSSEYIATDYFNRLLSKSSYNKEFQKKLNSIFSRFTSNIDELVEKVKDRWIQIKTENINPEGMIDLSFNDKEILIYFGKTANYNNDELILEYFEQIFLQSLEKGLKGIQTRFKNELKNTYITYINELETEVKSIYINQKKDEVYEHITNNIVLCRTNIQNEIDHTAEWFKLPSSKEYNDFTCKQLLEACYAINKKLYSQYDNLDISINNSTSMLLKGYTFSYFIEILIILFTNAIYHSEFVNEIEKLRIFINITENV